MYAFVVALKNGAIHHACEARLDPAWENPGLAGSKGEPHIMGLRCALNLMRAPDAVSLRWALSFANLHTASSASLEHFATNETLCSLSMASGPAEDGHDLSAQRQHTLDKGFSFSKNTDCSLFFGRLLGLAPVAQEDRAVAF